MEKLPFLMTRVTMREALVNSILAQVLHNEVAVTKGETPAVQDVP